MMEKKQETVAKAKIDLTAALGEITTISGQFLQSIPLENKDLSDLAIMTLQDATKTARNLIELIKTFLNDSDLRTNIKYEAVDYASEMNDVFSIKESDAEDESQFQTKEDVKIEFDNEFSDDDNQEASIALKDGKEPNYSMKGRKRRKRGDAKKEKSHICKFCPQILTSLTEKGKHMMEEHNYKFDCQLCGFKMKSAVAAHRHKKIHHPELYQHHCEVCGAGFETPIACEKHSKTCEGSLRKKGKSCMCTVCGKTLSNSSTLKCHLALHDSSYGKHKCEDCGKLYTTENLLNLHRRTQHEGDNKRINNTFPCEICGKILTRATGLRDHIKLVHDKIFDKECPHCEFKASTNVDLKKHIEGNHLGIRHTCDQCGMEFKYSNNLSQHKKVHSKERPFVCQECGSSFKKKCSMDRHVLTVHSTSSFPCHECGKMFKSELNLLAHTRSHDEDAQFPCELCSRKFVTRTKLKMHINTHTGATPYKCPHNCGKAFHSSDQLSHHKKQCRSYELYTKTNLLMDNQALRLGNKISVAPPIVTKSESNETERLYGPRSGFNAVISQSN